MMAEEGKQPDAAVAETGTEPTAEDDAPTPTVEETAVEAPTVEELTLEEAQGWKGFRLDEIGGSTAGKVEGVYVDAQSGRPEWLLARMGRFGHHCLVPARDAVGASGHVWVPYSRDEIRKAPKIEPGESLERGREQALLEHYGVASAEVGRGADLAEGDAKAVTARPA